MLSRYERRRLVEIEQSVERDDPAFAALFSGTPGRAVPRPHYRSAVMATVAGVVILLTGLVVLSPLLVLAGACLALRGGVRIVVMRWC